MKIELFGTVEECLEFIKGFNIPHINISQTITENTKKDAIDIFPNGPIYDKSAVILMIKEGNVILSKRTNTKTYRGYWQCPGGSIEKDEEPLVAAQREFYEETGIGLQDSRFELLTVMNGNQCPSVKQLYWYRVFLRPGEIPKNKEPEKQEDWQSFTIKDALNLKVVPSTELILKRQLRQELKDGTN